tara:strand:+ start:1226 stop:1528 length:303 start_codon:yes stop_codon:yes gene_type:complete
MEKIIKIALAILLFVCLLDMSYGYYQLVRFIALVGFSVLAYRSYEKEYKNEMIIYLGLALLFQPFFKIALGRDLWNIVDIIVGIGLLTTIFLKFDKLKKP